MPQKSAPLVVSLEPQDNPDWDHARTPHLALRVPVAEWCQSSVTELHPDGYYAPRNDFSYEGLLALTQGETWKFLDRLGFQLRRGEEVVAIEALQVEASPERVRYRYKAGAGELEVSYTLLDRGVDGPAILAVGFATKGKLKGLTLALRPVVDMRHMYHPSDPGRHRVKRAEPHHVTFVNSHRWLGIGSTTAFEFVARREIEPLSYPLGHGERESAAGKTTFRPEQRTGFVPGELLFALEGAVTVFVAAGEAEAPVLEAIRQAEASHGTWIAEQEARLADVFKCFPKADPRMVYRCYTMAEKFAMAVEGTRVPASGGWWFRTPWFRHLFEGYLHNWRTLLALDKGAMIEDSLRLALKYQDPGTGRLPSRLPEIKADLERWEQSGSLPADYYASPDGVLVMYTFLAEYLPEIKDEALLEACLQGFKRVFTAFKRSRLNLRKGDPVLLESGLLVSLPAHSWMDGKRVVWAEGITVTDLPLRAPANWQVQDILGFRDSHYTWEQYQYPTYFLPELNARWLKMLEAGQALAARFGDNELAAELTLIQSLAREAYKGIFWNPHAQGLYNLVTLERRIDGTPCAAEVEAAALLGTEVFTPAELEQIWVHARNRLLVKRKQGEETLPFGLIARDTPERVFLDNQQYHEAVVWPRETPYLIRLLRRLGHEEVVQQLLATNMAHQMDEGVVFYSHEMLSLPEGGNPSPNPDTEQNPVPVKNPMQWWSQWCDAFLDPAATAVSETVEAAASA